MLLFYCDNITSRIEYISRFLISEIGCFEFKMTCDKSEYQAFKGPSVNYSNHPFEKKEIHIRPSALLFEDSLVTVTPRVEKKEKEIEIRLPGTLAGQWVHDIFAAAFYLVSRYEEYLPYAPGKYNSFEANASVSYRNEILEIPLVNVWADALKKQILDIFPSVPLSSKKFSSVMSIDIDQAYAFQYRGVKRNLLSFFKNLLSLNFKFLAAQTATILFGRKDPYDTYEFLRKIQQESGLQFIYFINLGKYSEFDKNLDPRNQAMKRLVDELKEHASVGIHPSYFSNEEPEKFKSEINSLTELLGKTVTKSRQHYLKIKMPETYRNLLSNGITEDYSMGYATHPGFRAGTCTPFNWFDLLKNEETSLKIYPITFMEGNFGEDLGYSPGQAWNAMKESIDRVKKHEGYFLCIWHNHTVNERFFWKEWKNIFEQTIGKIKNLS